MSIGVGCHLLLQGIFPTQGLNPGPHNAGRCFTIWATREVKNCSYTVISLIMRETDFQYFFRATFSMTFSWWSIPWIRQKHGEEFQITGHFIFYQVLTEWEFWVCDRHWTRHSSFKDGKTPYFRPQTAQSNKRRDICNHISSTWIWFLNSILQ